MGTAVSSRGAPARVAVVVLDWNGGEETLACIDSVRASDYPALDVWLVDNASRAPVVDEARRRHPGLRTIVNSRNLGYSGGNNAGIRAALEAGAEFVLVLNNDAQLRPETIGELVRVGQGDTSVAAVGAKVLRADDPRRLWLAYGEINYRQSLVALIGADALDGPEYAAARDVAWVSGCAIFLSRAALERVGLFDEDFFAYHEEVDWCATARERGFRIVFAPRAIVYHRGAASSGGTRYVSRRQYLTARNMIGFARKHASAGQRLKLALFLCATLPLQYLRRLVSGEQAGVELKVRGILDALRGRPIPRAELGLD
ncbi:MAG TPA: glycosyltransferase family 2 protein [Candidatus Bathyarchaeia archaeon]|nr:glycosyltransferase family 2 protein [Candidatus Bathyarchaeia archaeon]